MTSPLRVALLWHSPNSGNLGVGALTVANIGLVREACAQAGREARFHVIGFADDEPHYPQLEGVQAWPVTGRSMLDPRAVGRAVRHSDLVLDIGGGDSFSDIYGLKRLTYLLATKALVLGARRPLVLAPQTLGPFRSRAAGALAEALVRAARRTYSRDELSVTALRSRRARERVVVTTDVAFALPFERRPGDGGPLRVGFNPSALLHHGGYSGTNQFGLKLDYPDFVSRLLSALRARDDVRVELVPHVVASDPVEDDLGLCRRLALEFDLPDPPVYRDPSAAKSFISGCDFFVGSRMHACIAAVSAGVPTVPLAYSRKFLGLFGSLGYEHTLEARELDAGAAVAAVLDALARREELERDAVAAGHRAELRLETYRDGLAELIRTL